MKTCLLFYFFMMINSYLILMFVMNIYLAEISYSPMSQLICVVLYMVWNSTNFYTFKPSMTIHIFMLLIIMASGMMILVSYFVSLSNMTRMKLVKFKYFYLFCNLVTGTFLILFLLLNTQIIAKMFDYKNDNMSKLTLKLFSFPNYYVFLVTIAFMLLMLILSSKMCFVKKKSLRNKLL